MYYLDLNRRSEERYDLRRFMARIDGTYDVFSSYLIRQLHGFPIAGSYRVTTSVNRPDLISFDIYQDSQYWWLLLEYNRIADWTELSFGVYLNFFHLTDLERVFLELGPRQLAMERAVRS